MSIPLEVCVDTTAGLTACAQGGADRIELCSALAVGGLTPSLGLMELAAAQSISVHAMIRPSPGGFIGNPMMLDQMQREIAAAKDLGLAGVVFGALTKDGHLDKDFLSALMEAATGLETTLHRAFDLTRSRPEALETAVHLGFDRILTSGGAKTATEGARQLADLKRQARDRIKIAAGSGITAQNVVELLEKTDVDEIHASCGSYLPVDRRISEFGFGPDQERMTDAGLIRAMKAAMSNVAL